MNEYIVIWHASWQTDGDVMFTHVFLDAPPFGVSDDEWVDMAEDAEGGDLDEYRPSIEGYSLFAVIQAPVNFVA